MVKNNLETFNENSGNLEIIQTDKTKDVEISDNEQAVKISPEGVNVKKGGNFVIGSLNLIAEPFKRRHERHYQENFWHLVADLILVLIIIALIFFSIFSFNYKSSDKVSLKINIDDQNISSGQLKTFELEYKTNDDLKDNKVKVELPRNFILENVSPLAYYNKEQNTFYLDNLAEGSAGKLKIEGYVIGNKDDHQMISFNFLCDKCGKNGVLSSYFYNISKYFIDFNLTFPDKIYSGGEFESKIFIKNNTSRDLSNLEINLGENLKVENTDLKIENNKIILSRLEARQSKEYILKSSFESKNEFEVNPEISFVFINDKFIFQDKKTKIQIEEPELKLELSSDRNNINNEEEILYKLKYENRSPQTLKDIKINLSSGQASLSILSISSATNLKNAQIDNNAIKINDLIPNESGEINLLVKFERRQIYPNQEAYLMANIEYQSNNQLVKYISYSNKSKLKSEVLSLVSVRYYSPQGDQLGVGPLPPAVGMATNYWVFLEFNNSGNDLKNFVLSAELPENVYFSDNKRVLDGKLTYAEIGKRLIWEINEMEGGVNKYRANFEIILIPENNDLGKILDLIKNIKFSVYDNFTKEEMNGNLNNITTNLENDMFSSGKGKVGVIK